MNQRMLIVTAGSLLLAGAVYRLQPWVERQGDCTPAAEAEGRAISLEERVMNEPLTADESILSDGVASIIDPDETPRSRVKSPLKLPKDLDSADIDTLLALLTSPRPDDLSRADWYELVNNICVRLNTQQDVPEGYSDALLAMLDGGVDPVIRDYAVQAIGVWYPRAGEGDRQRLNRALAGVITAPRDASAGTAVYAIHHLTINNPFAADFSATALDRSLLALAAGERDAVVATRMAAFHLLSVRVLSSESERAALQSARSVAADSSLPISLRKTAIHTLGQLGDRTDRPLLRQLADEHPRLAQASQPALDQLTQ